MKALITALLTFTLACLATGFSPASLPLLSEYHVGVYKRFSTCIIMKGPHAKPQAAHNVLKRRSMLGLLIAAPSAVIAQPVVKTEIAPVELACDQAISRLVNKGTGQEMYIIGTAHISQLSADLVRQTIRTVKPDTVMIELDEKRVRRGVGSPNKTAPEKPRSVWQLLREEFGRTGPSFGEKVKSFESGLIGMVIAGLYEKLNKMGFSSGQEFVVAIQEAKALNATLVLGDRGVDKTLSRLQETINKSGFQAVQKFIEAQSLSPTTAVVAKELENSEDMEAIAKSVEALKERSTVRELMSTLKSSLPDVYIALIQERDEYMANSLLKANGKSSVAVVGMAHMDGIERTLGEVGFEVVQLCGDTKQ